MHGMTPEQHLAFDIGMALKTSKRLKRVSPHDEPHWPMADMVVARLQMCGWTFQRKAMSTDVDAYRAVSSEARAALRMIREVVEQFAPPGSLQAEESVEQPLACEADALITGIIAVLGSKRRKRILADLRSIR